MRRKGREKEEELDETEENSRGAHGSEEVGQKEPEDER